MSCIICKKDSEHKGLIGRNYYICEECYNNINKTAVPKMLLKCDKHGWYLGGCKNALCPICNDEIRTVNCDICGNEFYCTDSHIQRIKNHTMNLVCDSCFEKLPGNGCHVRKCSSCNKFFKAGHNFVKCPICNERSIEKVEHQCESCGKIFYTANNLTKIISNRFCEDCREEYFKSFAVKFCEATLKRNDVYIKNDVVMLPIDLYHKRYRKLQNKICPQCGREFAPDSPNQIKCCCCFIINTCESCGGKYLTSNRLDDSQYYHACSRSCSVTLQQKYFGNNLLEYNNNIRSYNLDKDGVKIKLPKNQVEINDNNIDNFKNIAGVWFKYDYINYEVLDVMITTNIYEEYKYIKHYLDYPFKWKEKELSKIKDNIKYYWLKDFNTWNEGLDYEMDFALKTNARFWSASPGYQQKKLSEYKKSQKGVCL